MLMHPELYLAAAAMKFITMILALLMVMKQRKRCSSSSSSCCLKLSSFLLSCLSTSCTSLPFPPAPAAGRCSTHSRSSATMCSPSSRTRATSRLIVSMSRLSMYVPFAAASSCTSARRAARPEKNRSPSHAGDIIGNAANAARMCTPMQAPTTATTATAVTKDTDSARLSRATLLIRWRAFFLPASRPLSRSPEPACTSRSLPCDAASAVNGCPSAAETSARPDTPTSEASLRSVCLSGR
uniref:Uncharacterized protein n=2 Tax=Oryza TaxID=4527 RepID=A0A0D9Z228_9ORYZ